MICPRASRTTLAGRQYRLHNGPELVREHPITHHSKIITDDPAQDWQTRSRTPDYGIKLDQRTPNGSTPDSAPGSDRFGPAEQFCSLHLQAMAMPGLEVYQSVDYIEVGLLALVT